MASRIQEITVEIGGKFTNLSTALSIDTKTLEMNNTKMFIEEYKAGLMKDMSYKGLWKVSFSLWEV